MVNKDMVQNKQPIVYICADPQDSAETLYTVNKVVLQLGGTPVHLSYSPIAGEYDWPLISKTIDQSDLFILLVGDSYGAISETSPHT